MCATGECVCYWCGVGTGVGWGLVRVCYWCGVGTGVGCATGEGVLLVRVCATGECVCYW